jgi:rhodanese-related sulfurtransferase
MKTILFRTLFPLTAAVLVACGSTSAAEDEFVLIGQVVPVAGGGSYIDISPMELKAMLENEQQIFFVNVHIPNEGEIEGTDAHIPFDQITGRLSEFPTVKDASIIIYCRSGSMSAIAARDLVAAGYRSVFNLDGGFRAWQAIGYEFRP